jgi:hypothetical protein
MRRHRLPVAQEYVDVETAKQTGRAAFGEMVAYLKAHSAVRVMLVEKTEATFAHRAHVPTDLSPARSR